MEVMARVLVDAVGSVDGEAVGVDCAGVLVVLDGLLSGDVDAVWLVLPPPKVHAAAHSNTVVTTAAARESLTIDRGL